MTWMGLQLGHSLYGSASGAFCHGLRRSLDLSLSYAIDYWLIAYDDRLSSYGLSSFFRSHGRLFLADCAEVEACLKSNHY